MTLSLKERIAEDLKTAMRARDRRRVAALRLITAALKQREVDTRQPLDDEAVRAVLAKALKQRQESVAQFRAAGRSDLEEQEAYESALIESYLPRALDPAEIAATIDEVLRASGASSMKDMGTVMATLRSRLQGRADLGEVSRQVRARLASGGR